MEARNYCRRFCMDAVSFDTRAEYEAIADIIEDGKAVYQKLWKARNTRI